ncbi:flagellar hook-basal body complex protein FliE [Enterobacteriaceae bacterium LUAb1]
MNVKTDALGPAGSQHQILADMQRMQSQATGSVIAPSTVAVQSLSQASAAPSFSKILDNALNHVDSQQHLANEKQREIERGTSDDLVGAMVESQKASVAFSALLQVRNKLQQSFDDVMNISL